MVLAMGAAIGAGALIASWMDRNGWGLDGYRWRSSSNSLPLQEDVTLPTAGDPVPVDTPSATPTINANMQRTGGITPELSVGNTGYRKWAGAAEMGAGMIGIGQSISNYMVTKGNLGKYDVMAGDVVNNALEAQNNILQSFSAGVSAITFSATQRGIKSSSGVIQSNIEESGARATRDMRAIEVRKDMQVRTLQAQKKVDKIANRANLVNGVIGGGLNVMSGLGTMGAI